MDNKNHHQITIKTGDFTTCKQLERTISQDFSTFYREKIGCSVKKVTCTIFAKYLVIVAEEALSPLEISLIENGQEKILLDIRQSIDPVLKFQLNKLVQDIIEIEVIDLICDLNCDARRMVTIALLGQQPRVRRKIKY